MSDDTIKEILTRYRNVAVVGLSRDPTKYSYEVASYLKNQGFHIVPVNPFTDEVLGEKSYKSLIEMPSEVQRIIEIVDIFRPSQDVPTIVDQAIELKRLYDVLKVVWMQLGIVNVDAAESAKKAGLTVVMDRCVLKEHRRFFGSG